MFRRKKQQQQTEVLNPFADEVINNDVSSQFEAAESSLAGEDSDIVTPILDNLPKGDATRADLSSQPVETPPAPTPPPVPAPAPDPVPAPTPVPEPVNVSADEVLRAVEESASAAKPEAKPAKAVVVNGNSTEFDALLTWIDRDTEGKVERVQRVVDDLRQRITNIKVELEADTDGLSAEAKTLFEKNTRKNIELIEDQIGREQSRQKALKNQRGVFMAKLQDALDKYQQAPKIDDFQSKSAVPIKEQK